MNHDASLVIQRALDHAIANDIQDRIDLMSKALALFNGTSAEEELSKAKERNRCRDDGPRYEE